MAFDPNLISLSSIKLSSLEDILDIYVILVGHKGLKNWFNKKMIDFCGISNNSHMIKSTFACM